MTDKWLVSIQILTDHNHLCISRNICSFSSKMDLLPSLLMHRLKCHLPSTLSRTHSLNFLVSVIFNLPLSIAFFHQHTKSTNISHSQKTITTTSLMISLYVYHSIQSQLQETANYTSFPHFSTYPLKKNPVLIGFWSHYSSIRVFAKINKHFLDINLLDPSLAMETADSHPFLQILSDDSGFYCPWPLCPSAFTCYSSYFLKYSHSPGFCFELPLCLCNTLWNKGLRVINLLF